MRCGQGWDEELSTLAAIRVLGGGARGKGAVEW